METPVNQAVSQTETSDATAVWNACLDVIRERVNTQSFKTWFEPIVPVHLQGRALTVQVPSQFFYDWLEEHYFPDPVGNHHAGSREERQGGVHRPPGRDSARNSVPRSLLQPQRDARLSASAGVFTVRAPGRRMEPRYPQRDGSFQTFLNPRYTFENFIKGDSNQLARAAASAVANNPGRHVVQPAGHLRRNRPRQDPPHPGHRQLCDQPTARRGGSSTSRARSSRSSSSMRSRATGSATSSSFYRSMDVLIVDDIQFFSGKEKTQDNFFHTFNELHQIGKQIVLSSDRPPKELKGSRRPAALPVPVGTDGRYPAARPRDPHRDPPQEERGGRHRPSAGRRRVHRRKRHLQHPRTRGVPHQPSGPSFAGGKGDQPRPRAGRRQGRRRRCPFSDHHRNDPADRLRVLQHSGGPDSRKDTQSRRSSTPGRSPCTSRRN